ncbi:MAG: calcium-binding protein [Paracoccus sp. (in: a-proteobacteria)]
MFDYKGDTTRYSAQQVDLAHQLSAYSQAGTFDDPTKELLSDILDGDVTIPDGWNNVSAATLGLGPEVVDSYGFLTMDSPITGRIGPQLLVLEERDAGGNVTNLAISFAGTNSLIDVLDYPFLNAGAMAQYMTPILEAVRGYADELGLTAEDVMITGYSLGGAYTNIMARDADTLVDGYFADSLYIAHEPNMIYDNPDRILNVGYENSVIFREGGTQTDLWDAIGETDPFLANNDWYYESSTDNIVLFDATYIQADLLLAIDSAVNLFSWGGHVSGIATNAWQRIAESAFYDFTLQDSAVVVANLDPLHREYIWVEDKDSPTSNHYGKPAFIVGSYHDDLLGDGAANDYIDGLSGNDVIRVSSGYNVVEGGAGYDTLRLQGSASDFQAWKLADGSYAIASDDGLTIMRGVEDVELTHPGFFGPGITAYSIASDRFEDDHFSFFQLGDQDIAFSQACQGTVAGNWLYGSGAIFGLAGDDRIYGQTGNDLLNGGSGEDRLNGGAGNDRLYGAEHDDILAGNAGSDRLNGGHGDDIFVFNAADTGTDRIEDFNQTAGEADIIRIVGAFNDYNGMLAASTQWGDDILIRAGSGQIIIEDMLLADLDQSGFAYI